MSRQAAARLAWSLWALVVALEAATAVLGAMAGEVRGRAVATLVVAFLVFQVFATVGRARRALAPFRERRRDVVRNDRWTLAR